MPDLGEEVVSEVLIADALLVAYPPKSGRAVPIPLKLSKLLERNWVLFRVVAISQLSVSSQREL